MTLTEKAAYLRGLAEGLKLDPEKDETKMFNAIMDVLDDLTMTAADLEDNLSLVSEQVDAVDEDLDELESYVYDDDYDYDYDDDDECYEIECPNCHETICIDDGILDEGSIECPNCHENLELEIDDDCGCDGCDGCEDDGE
ncbi:MAG: hypothetical protein K6F09_08165 [Clostridiales bacterium]|nr:hypothetical protein [Clostridiales bacterium]